MRTNCLNMGFELRGALTCAEEKEHAALVSLPALKILETVDGQLKN